MNKTIILGHENPDYDSIVSGIILEKIMKKKGYAAEFIIPDKNISEENIMLSKICNIDPTKYQKEIPYSSLVNFILVDHNERDVNGNIIAIIDHHPTQKNITCNYYKNEPACSTSCLIAKDNEDLLTTDELKAVCLSAMVDTAAFHSNKTIEKDVIWVKNICKKYNFDYNKLLTLSMCPTNLSNIKEASLNGLKKHNLNGHIIASSFVHVENIGKYTNEITEIIEQLKIYRQENNYEIFLFIVHDINNFSTKLYKIYEDKIDIINYENYTSRGTKIIPTIEKELKENN